MRCRVTDVNDNAPVFSSGSYRVTLSEVAQVGSLVIGLQARDADQPGPLSTVEYKLVEGPHSRYLHIPSPLQGQLLLQLPLDYEAEPVLEVQVEASDQGNPPNLSTAFLTITVLDADDQNPAFVHDHYTALLPDDAMHGDQLTILPGSLLAVDQDLGLNSSVVYSFSGSGREQQYFRINPNKGVVAVEEKPEEQGRREVTLVVRATQTDNPDRYAVATLTISLGGRGSRSLGQQEYRATVPEGLPVGTPVLSLGTATEGVTYGISSEDLPGGQFEVKENGDVVLVKPLDFESEQEFSFTVIAWEGSESSTAVVNISVTNTNDWGPRFGEELYRFTVGDGEAKAGAVVGRVEVGDSDLADTISLKLMGEDARAFEITPLGEIIIVEPARLNATVEAHLVVAAEDSGQPPRHSSVPVVVRIGRGRGASSRHLKVSLPNWFILWIFFLVLIILVVIILSLGIYICQTKHKLKQSLSSDCSVSSLEQERATCDTPATPPSRGNPYISRPQSFRSHSNGSLQTTTSSGVLSSSIHLDPYNGCEPSYKVTPNMSPIYVYNDPHTPTFGDQDCQQGAQNTYNLQPSTNSFQPLYTKPLPKAHRPKLTPRERRRQRNKVTPLGSTESRISSSSGGEQEEISRSRSERDLDSSLQQELRARILGAGSRLEFPRASIPRRVSKLSWEEEAERDLRGMQHMGELY